MKTENRTSQQNRALFKFHELVANTMNQSGITLNKLIIEIEPRPTKESLHIIFKGILESMFQKTTTTKMTRKEFSECLEVYIQALSIIGITLDFPDSDKNNLIGFFD